MKRVRPPAAPLPPVVPIPVERPGPIEVPAQLGGPNAAGSKTDGSKVKGLLVFLPLLVVGYLVTGEDPAPTAPADAATRKGDSAAAPKHVWEFPLGNLAFKITSCFGSRNIGDGPRLHLGVDLRATYDTCVQAIAAGRVVRSGYDPGFGNFVEIDHGNGWTSLYAHMRELRAQRLEYVAAREVLGYVGDTGHSIGPHLHLETRLAGTHIDPLAVLRCTYNGAQLDSDCKPVLPICPVARHFDQFRPGEPRPR